MPTATLSGKVNRGPVASIGRGGGCVADAGISAAGASDIKMSRCGLPHLWQNRASGGNCEPHVQKSGIVGTLSVTHASPKKQLSRKSYWRLALTKSAFPRSEERRVGKEWRSLWAP